MSTEEAVTAAEAYVKAYNMAMVAPTPNLWNTFHTEKADLYEKTHHEGNAINYVGPTLAAEAVVRCLEDNHSARILDAACGTGAAAEKLIEKGYSNIDGLDANRAMLDLAEKKNLYKQTYCVFVGDETFASRANGTYDLVCCCGGFAPDMIPTNGFLDLVKLVKPGGFFINMIGVQWYNHPFYKALGPLIEKLQEEKIIDCVEKTQHRYWKERVAYVCVYKVM
ncbi:methyltransferase-like protein 27 isoform X1 [Lineus longissimus]|uniref:methyltransferase-like protein 27 isoform X1 n=1 Tax=Lineus longissimus TaxID=88925 RepID=UPI002B4C385F